LGLFILGYILLLSLSYGELGIQPIFTIIIGVYLWLLGKNIHVVYHKYGGAKIFLGLLLLGGVIRFLWAIFIPTLPGSDFQYYHEATQALSQGVPTVTKNMGFPLLLSLGYRIYPSILTGKIINAIASTLSIFLLYRIGSKLITPQTGLFAAFLFIILPSEIIMVSVLGTEVVGTTIGLIIAFFLFCIDVRRFKLVILFLFLAGLFYGLALTVRSSFLFYFPAIVLYIFLINSLNIKQKAESLSIFLVGITAGLCLIVIGYSLIAGHISIAPLRTQDTFPFLSGTNADSLGQWNQKDADLYYSWPSEERDKLAIQEALDRIISNPKKFLQLIPVKIYILMGPNDYGNAWSLNAIDWGEGNLWGTRATDGKDWHRFAAYHNLIIRISGLLSQSIYIVIWFFAFYAFLDKKIIPISLIVLTLIILTLLPHIVLEVQGRYHHYIMPLVVLLASYGIITDSINKETGLA
jgi:hypothetical protein